MCFNTPNPPPSPVHEPPPETAKLDLSVCELAPTKPFSPDALQAHSDAYFLPLARHLNEEISTLAPKHIEKVGETELARIDSEVRTRLQDYDPSCFCVILWVRRAHEGER